MPKREDEFWASQKEGLRYCSKHKHYYREDIGCQLCWVEEHKGKASPKLRQCPTCQEISLFQRGDNLFECLNVKCSKYQKAQNIQSQVEQRADVTGSSSNKANSNAAEDREHVSDEESMRLSAVYGRIKSIQAKNNSAFIEPIQSVVFDDKKKFGQSGKRGAKELPTWIIVPIFVFALSTIGTGISIYAGTFIPLWILFGYSAIYSIEKWFNYYTRRHKWIGKLYRLILNLSILSLLGLLIWTGTRLFSIRFTYSALVGSLIFFAVIGFFIWLWRVILRNSWRWPSMKLTVFSLLGISVVFAFAGVQPLSTYKDEMITRIGHTMTTVQTTSTNIKLSESVPTQTQVNPNTASVNEYVKMFNQFRQS